ncbi:MAG: response regulator [Ruminococcus sp.]|nr:response regulator [Ruminococcus sp.]
MWAISCILLIIGTVAGICGTSFYLRNREAAGSIRSYIFSCGLSAAVWCIFFGCIGFCEDFAVCARLRSIGDIGIDAFLITETFLITNISGAKKRLQNIFRLLAVIMGIIDFIIFSQDYVNIYIRENGWTTWLANPAGSFNRTFHGVYIAFTFIVLLPFALLWIKNNKAKRLNRFLAMVFVANFTMLFFSFPDTFLPALGKTAIPTSGMGAAVCVMVIWYGASQLSSFDLRMGNIRDRVFDFIETGVIVFDTDHKTAVINRFAEELAQEEGLRGNSLTDFFDVAESAADKMFVRSENEIYNERLWNTEHTNAYSVRLNAIKDNYGEVFCYICVFVDVTEEVKAVTKYEIASRAKSRFLAQMSHEIRTPINAVLGMNEMILRESADEEILSYAENIGSAGNTLLSLINSILDFSKIEDGKMEIVTVKYDTASFINDLANSIIQRADSKGLKFSVNVDGNLPCAMIGDNVRFSQVIMNLLTNAVKYTEKGSVTLDIGTEQRNGEDIDIHVSVKDTGIGIKEEDRDKLFESFERLDEVRNHSIEGTGLGMSIVTSLLNLMGSRLTVKSTYGKGSEFSFVIKQQIADETPVGDYEKRLRESSHHVQRDTLIEAPSARILIVDDNEMNLKVARNLMKLCKIKPDTAASGEETIELMKRSEYDIVFLDHMMPGMDGIETLKRLKEEGLIPEHTVMIALTANAVVGARETYLSAGFKDYLSKPIEIRQLVRQLEEYLPESAYHEAAAAENNTSAEKAQSADVFDKLTALGLDVQSAMEYFMGDRDFYLEMTADFAVSCAESADLLDELHKAGKLNDYRIKVHALKSNARSLGATDISKQALALETAAKDNDAEYIENNHERLVSSCKAMSAKLKELFGSLSRER